MKILYSHRTQSADGQYVHIRELTSALSARGHDVFLAGPSGRVTDETKSLNVRGGGSDLRALLPGAVYELAELAYGAPAYWRLRNLYQTCKPDVLYQRYNLFYHPGSWLHRARQVPFILEVNAPLALERARHGNLALKGMARKSERDIWRSADMVLPVTNVLADMVRAAGVADEKIQVIQNGVGEEFLRDVDNQKVRDRYALKDRLVLGFTGFVREWHGVDKALRFMATSGRDDLHLLLVGDGPARAQLEALAGELNIADRMTITGVVQREEIPEHVAAFDIALQPAVVDYASPLKLFEYMALSRATIAPDSANICEVLTTGADSLLFDQGDPEAFEKALGTLIEDEALRERLGAAARASLLRQGLTWAENAARVEKIAADLVGKKQ